MVETAIFAQWLQCDWFVPWYARWTVGRNQGEVGMVGLSHHNFEPAWALEIKWSNRFYESPGELKALMNFCETNNLNSALVTTINKSGSKDMKLIFLPSALYAYAVGKNTIIQRLKNTI